ncbi:trifunctional serine/threonine-protein kinase/ATP-binding protein/sensor histidine kinase [Roseofilum casamattae]|uniref:histidine kinase n=1 Tax=Roseofilum casamattae BLCC-M143 TaxID=3022442 RepID=A0ABT7BTF7_9CYAN|nr:ATP-binding sensor histidine kinase [Roseofilum casamattae]MDJ1182472.1 AAA family ATPase [Roseofilum casamattae BLCC-M143]
MNTSAITLPQISSYQAIALIYESDRTLVYRALDLETGQPVVIKLMRNEYPSFNELVRFRNQYAISKNLEVEGIIQPYALERYKNRYALIMEDVGGISLAEYKDTSSLSIVQFLEIALQLANILHHLHQNKIIHKDIKPANILIHPETKQVTLIDLSISTLLPKETQNLQTLNVLEGTLAYLSPEQTGRMNRAIDYRSDFYSLGIAFYEILAGRVPFSSNDPLELIHAHIAHSPEPISKLICLEGQLCPIPLSDIVSKLMAKNAEDRYQSALGLKYDLENCLSQWQETRKIESFVLGERDRCDRFLIPEKLYGREQEVQALLAAFERVADGGASGERTPSFPHAELILVAGFSGVGKTAVVNEVHKPITRQRGYFLEGKFDQFNRDIPFSAFVQAFRDLTGQLLSESDAALASWKTKILEAVGDNGRVLIEAIPELERAIGSQPPIPELSGTAAQTRFKLLFQKFIAVFATPEHPLVLFLDDLQWADSASLNLIAILMEDNAGSLLAIGAYRDNEVFPAHPLMLMLADLEKQRANLSTITLPALSPDSINLWVAETLNCSLDSAQPLTELLYQKAKGNPFFTAQFLKGLHEDGLIFFNQEVIGWEFDLPQMQNTTLAEDVVEFMAERLQKLPRGAQDILKFAACLGNRFTLESLAVVCDRPQEAIAADLWSALQENFIIPESDTYKFFQGDRGDTGDTEVAENILTGYRFLHDRVQQAAYNLIPDDRKQATHLAIGRLLLQNPSESETNIFAIVNHWNMAIDLIDNSAQQIQLAGLNLQAGLKAKSSVAYEPALKYFQTGLNLLSDDCWQTQYELALNLYTESAKTALICGQYARMEQQSEIVLQNGRTVLDRVEMYDVRIQAQMARAKPAIAIQIAFAALNLLEIALPETPTPADIQHELEITQKLWQQQNIADLVDLPPMTNPEMLSASIILSSIFAPSFIAKADILPLIACKQIQLSLHYGNCEYSAFGYSNYSAILNTICHDLEASYEFGQLAIALVEKLNAKSVKARTFNQAAIFSMHGKVHLKAAPPILKEGCQSGVENGDLEFAGYAAYNWSQYSYFSGLNLIDLQKGAETYGLLLEQIDQQISLSCNQIVQQAALNLLGHSDDVCQLTGAVFNEEEALRQFTEDRVFSGIQYLFLHKIVLCFLFAKFDRIQDYIERWEQYLNASTGMITVPSFYFYATLSRLQLYSQSPANSGQILPQIEDGMAEMRRWAEQAPMNFQHKSDLIVAEYERILGDRYRAADFYDRAITGARANEYVQDEALANELAAKFYLDWDFGSAQSKDFGSAQSKDFGSAQSKDFGSAQSKGKEKVAAGYMQEAYYCYFRWEAKAKTTDLENRYSELLYPILQGLTTSIDVLNTLTTIASPVISVNSGTCQGFNDNNLNQTLDFASILKASQALSGTIQLDELLCQLVQIILQNSGGDRCALILPTDTEEWQIRAIATPKETQLCRTSLTDTSQLPIKLLQYVKNTREVLVIDNLETDLPAIDDYLIEHKPKSLLCLPILHQGHLIGLLYLQNSLTIGIFTQERITILNFLCTQAAISLENARLYQRSQEMADNLQHALNDLQQTQLQLVQNEKMATLGNLVAGVAHEINNPLGFISGNVNILQENLTDLSAIVEGYREEYPEPSPQLAEEIEELDLDFLLEDIPKTIASMEEGVKRIGNISTSLRTFSRTDTDRKTEFNLHEGIDSTLLILKYRLKANEQRPAIEIVKNYGNIPTVKCYPGQLNQVFMNILANAIDAFDEANQGKSYQEIESSPNIITIHTSTIDKQVKIQIQDNGCGMKPETIEKIFEQGFTTKGVGKGTGLGMAIARQIIVEKHGGAIDCNSEVGQGTKFIISLSCS